MSPAVAVLGRAALLPSPMVLLPADPDLGKAAPPAARARTLSGRLGAAPEGMPRWPRLDRYGKALAAVCDTAVNRDTVAAGPPTGLYVASLRSCLETNTAFDLDLLAKEPRLASPLLFPYTLPGSTASEVAMLLGLAGAYLVFPGDAAAALAAVVAAADALEEEEAERVLVAAADVLGEATLEWLELPDKDQPPLAEAAAAIWLGRPGDTAPGARRMIEAALGPARPGVSGYERILRECLERARVDAAAIVEGVSTTVEQAEHAVQAAALSRLVPELPTLQLPCTVGDAGAALGILGVQAALDEDAARIILAGGHAGSIAVVVA